MSMMKEFREFAMRGNVVDMAVGVIIGGAFGTIVKSVIDDLVMPPVGKIVGGVDFSNLYVPLTEKIDAVKATALATNAHFTLALADAKKIGPVFAYGNFLTVLLNFVILAFCIFMVVKAMNTMKKRLEKVPAKAADPTTKECPQCFSTIPVKAVRCPHCTSQIA
jgi:large conductance mechanosensitive channel